MQLLSPPSEGRSMSPAGHEPSTHLSDPQASPSDLSESPSGQSASSADGATSPPGRLPASASGGAGADADADVDVDVDGILSALERLRGALVATGDCLDALATAVTHADPAPAAARRPKT